MSAGRTGGILRLQDVQVQYHDKRYHQDARRHLAPVIHMHQRQVFAGMHLALDIITEGQKAGMQARY